MAAEFWCPAAAGAWATVGAKFYFARVAWQTAPPAEPAPGPSRFQFLTLVTSDASHCQFLEKLQPYYLLESFSLKSLEASFLSFFFLF